MIDLLLSKGHRDGRLLSGHSVISTAISLPLFTRSYNRTDWQSHPLLFASVSCNLKDSSCPASAGLAAEFPNPTFQIEMVSLLLPF